MSIFRLSLYRSNFNRPGVFRLGFFIGLGVCLALLQGCAGQSADSSSGGSNGSSSGSVGSQAGSTATMINQGNILYILDKEKLKALDLSTSPATEVLNTNSPGAETLFIYEDHLYVGGVDKVEIYNIESPSAPFVASQYPHLRSCDPVIVSADIGYVTLRNSGRCATNTAGVNRLEIVDFSDPQFPEKITEYNMPNPFGLAKTDTYLAICQEFEGLALVDVSDHSNIQTLTTYDTISCFDAIYRDSRLVVTADDGIYQFHTGITELTELSRIPVGI